MARRAPASATTFSAVTNCNSCAWISATVIRRSPNCRQRDRMVIGSFCGSVVASMNLTCGGGSSSVFSSALKAPLLSMWTSSIR